MDAGIREIAETEAKQFIISSLAFIEEQSSRFNTSEEFIEDSLFLLLILIKKARTEL